MKYHVEFYFEDDLRCKINVDASDEVRALIFALDQINMEQDYWIDELGFSIEISMAIPINGE